MNKEFYSLDEKERKRIIDEIRKILQEEENIIFAYLYGSFLNALSFRDIDIGIYLNKIDEKNIEELELKMIKEISKKINLPFEIIDLRVLNYAKNSFLNNIFRTGLLLFTRDEKFLTDLIETTSLEAISNEYISYLSLKELLP
ncbi:nucleotidyltransferase domain-containing protein [Dictyoglomus thermophilum]|uniref:Nucleotidyltransferase n=1 Tax=Dictyoglomus thermophilum (strain ATCC 35947 / DSM 3960 / H-6-12) TaxID=309799 RepID=B5YC16_DICT6|nr:nucleotidyltransferase domain-containing protein [Dictyoglomus thermophilum]ACI18880.1 nucleotidyltransferase [Dictyoglomus thermophilum H-6-12]